MSSELAKLTPEQKYINAMKDYVETLYPDETVMIGDWLLAVHVVHIEERGSFSYNYLSNPDSPPHSLRGLADKLSLHVIRME